jgi:hypothetical protein
MRQLRDIGAIGDHHRPTLGLWPVTARFWRARLPQGALRDALAILLRALAHLGEVGRGLSLHAAAVIAVAPHVAGGAAIRLGTILRVLIARLAMIALRLRPWVLGSILGVLRLRGGLRMPWLRRLWSRMCVPAPMLLRLRMPLLLGLCMLLRARLAMRLRLVRGRGIGMTVLGLVVVSLILPALIVLRRPGATMILRQRRGGEERKQRGRTQHHGTHLNSPWRGVNGKGGRTVPRLPAGAARAMKRA